MRREIDCKNNSLRLWSASLRGAEHRLDSASDVGELCAPEEADPCRCSARRSPSTPRPARCPPSWRGRHRRSVPGRDRGVGSMRLEPAHRGCGDPRGRPGLRDARARPVSSRRARADGGLRRSAEGPDVDGGAQRRRDRRGRRGDRRVPGAARVGARRPDRHHGILHGRTGELPRGLRPAGQDRGPAPFCGGGTGSTAPPRSRRRCWRSSARTMPSFPSTRCGRSRPRPSGSGSRSRWSSTRRRRTRSSARSAIRTGPRRRRIPWQRLAAFFAKHLQG